MSGRLLLKTEFRDEQDFKTWCMGYIKTDKSDVVFEIENEEKEPGFPDLLKIDFMGRAFFYEIKVARKRGRFTFESTQPRFYKLHPNLNIKVIVWDAEMHIVYFISALEAADKVLEKSSLTLNVREF